MTKDIKDYLHLYLGQLVTYMNGEVHTLRGVDIDYIYSHPKPASLRLHLRPLSDMTEGEKMWFFNSLRQKHEGLDYSEWITEYNGNPVEPHWVLWVKDQRTKHGYTIGINNHFKAKEFRWLLSKGFDLFGLIEAGLAIDKTTLTEKV